MLDSPVPTLPTLLSPPAPPSATLSPKTLPPIRLLLSSAATILVDPTVPGGRWSSTSEELARESAESNFGGLFEMVVKVLVMFERLHVVPVPLLWPLSRPALATLAGCCRAPVRGLPSLFQIRVAGLRVCWSSPPPPGPVSDDVSVFERVLTVSVVSTVFLCLSVLRLRVLAGLRP